MRSKKINKTLLSILHPDKNKSLSLEFFEQQNTEDIYVFAKIKVIPP